MAKSDALAKIQQANDDLRSEYGGTVLDGSSGDPFPKGEEPSCRQEIKPMSKDAKTNSMPCDD